MPLQLDLSGTDPIVPAPEMPAAALAVVPEAVGPGLAAAGAAAPPADPLPVTYKTQAPFGNLCWAACCQMVLDLNKIVMPQICQVVSLVLDPNCCAQGMPPSCNQGVFPYDAYPKLKFNCTTKGGTMTMTELAAEVLTNQRPVEVQWDWNTTGSHVVLVTGVWGNGYVDVLDPRSDRIGGIMLYDDLCKPSNEGTWTNTYYNLYPLPGPAAGAGQVLADG
jgi:hypothetical protein